MARQFIYHMQGLNKTYPGGKKVLENIHLSFYPDAKIGVLGVNGSGKSTLLRIMAGIDKEFNGEGFVAEGATVGYLPQEPKLDETSTCASNVMLGVAAKKDVLDRYNDLAMNYSDETADEMTRLQDEIEAKSLWDLDARSSRRWTRWAARPTTAEVAKLSGGEKRRVALCKLLLEQPELLLLDEPTNHLDAETVNWLEGHLRSYPGAILIVTHDRYFLDNVTSWILELDRGTGIPYEGNYSSWLEQKQKRLQQEGREYEARQRAIEAESDWIASCPKRARPSPRRVSSAMTNWSPSRTTRRRARPRSSFPWRSGSARTSSSSRNLNKGFGDQLLIDGLSFKLPPGGIVGVIGPNGAGKTTLFRMITGQDKPDAGEIEIGESVQLGYVDQSRDALDDKKNVWEEISGGNDVIYLGKREINSRGYCSTFNFKGADQQKKVGMLSGGERNRVHLAKMLKVGRQPPAARRTDQRSRHRHLARPGRSAGGIRRLRRDHQPMIASSSTASPRTCWPSRATAMWNGSKATSPDYEEDKKRRLGMDSVIPHRLKYKKFSR